MGHLIHSECGLIADILADAKYPPLPAGFKEKYTKEASKSDTGYLSKSAYLDLFAKVREATIAAAGKLTDADLDKPIEGPMAKMRRTGQHCC